jgi:hypothetical protein
MKFLFQPAGLIGFVLASLCAVIEGWSLQEFCWSTWLAALAFSWACVIVAVIRILLTARTGKGSYEAALPFIRRVSPAVFLLALVPITLLAGLIALYLYSLIFSFYGIFLSVFAEMEPHSLFGRNGFINSDFFTPVTYLSGVFWPMIAGTLIAHGNSLLQGNPWERMLLPFRSRRILCIHILTIAQPFLTLIAWALFKNAYQPVTIVLLIAVFCLLTDKKPGEVSTLRA